MRKLLAAGWLAATLAACGSSSGGSKPVQGSEAGGAGEVAISDHTPLDDYPQAFVQAYCKLIERCWSTYAQAAEGSCTSTLGRQLVDQAFANISSAVSDGSIAYHPQALPACLEALASAACDAPLLGSCPEVFEGSRQTGEDCTLDEQCAGDAQCVVSGGCPGSCAPAPKLGEKCSPATLCAAGLICAIGVTEVGTCVAPVAEGAACNDLAPCSGLLYCGGLDRSVPDSTGTCQTRDAIYSAEQGAACSLGGAGTLCRPGLVCVFESAGGASDGTCRERVASAAACTLAQPDQCPEGEYCKLESAAGVSPAVGHCSAAPQLGESCRDSPLGVAPCADGQFCNTSSQLCALYKHLGEACSEDTECYSRSCGDGGKCVALLECQKP